MSFLSPNPQSQSTEDNSKHWMQPVAYSSATRLLKKEHCCLYAGWLMQVPYQWQVNKWQLVAVLLSSHFLLCKWQHILFTHAGIATVVGNAFSRVCLCVCLSVCLCCNRKTAWAINQTWYVHTLLQSSLCWLALTHRSKGQKVKVTRYENRTVAWLLVTMVCIPYTYTPLCYLRPLPAWVCMSIRLPMFSSFKL